jgi:hypothetical protein
MGWFTSAIPALRRLRQEDHEFKANLSYISTSTKPKKKKKPIKTKIKW